MSVIKHISGTLYYYQCKLNYFSRKYIIKVLSSVY